MGVCVSRENVLTVEHDLPASEAQLSQTSAPRVQHAESSPSAASFTSPELEKRDEVLRDLPPVVRDTHPPTSELVIQAKELSSPPATPEIVLPLDLLRIDSSQPPTIPMSSSSSSAVSCTRIKGILKRSSVSPLSPSFCTSPVSRRRKDSLFTVAKENALNFLMPMRRYTARERMLERVHRWWEDESYVQGATDWHPRVVRFEIDRATIPRKLLAMHCQISDAVEGNSRGLSRSPSVANFGTTAQGEVSTNPKVSGNNLPSLELRRWQRLGKLVGIAFGMREISRCSKSASDPELELISVDEKQVIGVEARFFMPSEASDVASCHSLDSKATKLLLQRAAGPANSGTLIRSCSETQSDYVLDAGISIRSQIDKTNIMFVRTCTPKESFEEENKVSSSSDQEDVSLNSIMTDAKGPCVMEEVFELHVDE